MLWEAIENGATDAPAADQRVHARHLTPARRSPPGHCFGSSSSLERLAPPRLALGGRRRRRRVGRVRARAARLPGGRRRGPAVGGRGGVHPKPTVGRRRRGRRGRRGRGPARPMHGGGRRRQRAAARPKPGGRGSGGAGGGGGAPGRRRAAAARPTRAARRQAARPTRRAVAAAGGAAPQAGRRGGGAPHAGAGGGAAPGRRPSRWRPAGAPVRRTGTAWRCGARDRSPHAREPDHVRAGDHVADAAVRVRDERDDQPDEEADAVDDAARSSGGTRARRRTSRPARSTTRRPRISLPMLAPVMPCSTTRFDEARPAADDRTPAPSPPPFHV